MKVYKDGTIVPSKHQTELLSRLGAGEKLTLGDFRITTISILHYHQLVHVEKQPYMYRKTDRVFLTEKGREFVNGLQQM